MKYIDSIPARIKALRVELADLIYRSRHSPQARLDAERVRNQISELQLVMQRARNRGAVKTIRDGDNTHAQP